MYMYVEESDTSRQTLEGFAMVKDTVCNFISSFEVLKRSRIKERSQKRAQLFRSALESLPNTASKEKGNC